MWRPGMPPTAQAHEIGHLSRSGQFGVGRLSRTQSKSYKNSHSCHAVEWRGTPPLPHGGTRGGRWATWSFSCQMQGEGSSSHNKVYMETPQILFIFASAELEKRWPSCTGLSAIWFHGREANYLKETEPPWRTWGIDCRHRREYSTDPPPPASFVLYSSISTECHVKSLQKRLL